jgi:hypothetical protein
MIPDALTWLVAGGILVGFAALVVLLLIASTIQRRRLRHTYDQLVATHHNTRDAYRELRDRTSGGDMTTDDRALLEELAEELVGCLVSVDEQPLLTDAEGVNVATIPVPVVEIEYPDRLVTLTLTVERYAAEEVKA